MNGMNDMTSAADEEIDIIFDGKPAVLAMRAGLLSGGQQPGR